MASTNHTTNYNLSQYIGGDKPTYLGDYNGDMQKIDAQMKTNADNIATAISGVESATSTANSAVSTANSAQSTANSASSTATSASTTASNAQSTANSALSTATSAQTTANSALTKANDLANLLTFTAFDDNITLSANTGEIYTNELHCATNSDGTVGKLYGRVRVRNVNSSATQDNKLRITGNTALRPTTAITINCLGISAKGTGSLVSATIGSPVDVNISTNGNIEMVADIRDTSIEFLLFPCLLFMVDFGDTPTPPESN